MKRICGALLLLAACVPMAYTQNEVVRAEGDFRADYSFAGGMSTGRAFEAGKVVYYYYPNKVECDVYVDSMNIDSDNPPRYIEITGMHCPSVLWPVPVRMNTDEVLCDTTVTYDMLGLYTRDAQKIMKFIGMGMDVHRCEATYTYLPSGQVGAVAQECEFTGKGVNYRRIFNADSVDYCVKVRLSSLSPSRLDRKEAKAMRKAERKKRRPKW